MRQQKGVVVGVVRHEEQPVVLRGHHGIRTPRRRYELATTTRVRVTISARSPAPNPGARGAAPKRSADSGQLRARPPQLVAGALGICRSWRRSPCTRYISIQSSVLVSCHVPSVVYLGPGEVPRFRYVPYDRDGTRLDPMPTAEALHRITVVAKGRSHHL